MTTNLLKTFLCLLLMASFVSAAEPLEIVDRLELFIDDYLIESMQGDVQQKLLKPEPKEVVLVTDAAWEGNTSGYYSFFKDGGLYRLYYRGKPVVGKDGDDNESTCYAESKDGIHWTRPELTLFKVAGSEKNNVVLANAAPLTHNFSPMLDTRPDVPKAARFKALAGTMEGGGLFALSSADGIHWEKMQDKAVIPKEMVKFRYMFDSQNVAFWSEHEKRYLSYFRVFEGKIRRICRSESDDFIHWSKPVLMEYQHQGEAAPLEHLYTNQTQTYFRAPHIFVATAARFMPGRQVLSDAQAKAIKVSPKYFKDTSDSIFMTSRGGNSDERTFLSSFIRPGIGAKNWVSRTNYPALNVVQTSPTEMSVYTNQDYAQASAHLRRYSLRIDGFASLQADYKGENL